MKTTVPYIDEEVTLASSQNGNEPPILIISDVSTINQMENRRDSVFSQNLNGVVSMERMELEIQKLRDELEYIKKQERQIMMEIPVSSTI
jgi:hypothetical protein